MSTKVTITKRIDPCNCGCHGSDPWHQKSYERVIRDVVETTGAVATCMGTSTFDKRATVRVPWSDEPVEVVHVVHVVGTSTFDKTYSFGWFFPK